MLLDYGMHQRRLFPLLARTYALHFAQERVAADLHAVFSDTADDGAAELARRSLESRAAGTKALGTWHASRTIQECREACGGAGYLSVNRFDALRADTDVFTTFEGDNTILMQLVAKGLLTDYKDAFEDLDQIGMVRFVASTAVETVLERTNARSILERLRAVVPVAARSAGEDRGRRAARGQLPPRDARPGARSTCSPRWPGGSSAAWTPGRDPAEVFSLCQDHVISAAHAHVERIVLEAFLDKLAATPRRARTATRSSCSATSTRSPASRPTGPGSSSTAGSPTPAPRRSRPGSTS